MNPIPIKSPELLSDRQREVLMGLASGETRKSIALTLKISQKTVEYHAMHLMNVLGIYSVAELTQYALATKLIESKYSAEFIEEVKPVIKVIQKSSRFKWKGDPSLQKYASVFGMA